MSRRKFLGTAAGLAAIALAGCGSTPGSPQEAAAKRQEIDAKSNTALARLYEQAKGSKEMADKAQGVLVFPSVIAGGLIVGGEYGEGALRVGGKTVDYYKTASGSFGFIAGGQSKSVIMMFMTKEAYDKFRASNGWTAGIDASVAVAKMGANAQVDTASIRAPVVVFVSTNSGLLADLSLEGTKVSKLNLGM